MFASSRPRPRPEFVGPSDRVQRRQGAQRAQNQPADPETTQEATEASLPAERRPQEPARQEQEMAGRGEEVRLRPRQPKEGQDEEEDVRMSGDILLKVEMLLIVDLPLHCELSTKERLRMTCFWCVFESFTVYIT